MGMGLARGTKDHTPDRDVRGEHGKYPGHRTILRAMASMAAACRASFCIDSILFVSTHYIASGGSMSYILYGRLIRRFLLRRRTFNASPPILIRLAIIRCSIGRATLLPTIEKQ